MYTILFACLIGVSTACLATEPGEFEVITTTTTTTEATTTVSTTTVSTTTTTDNGTADAASFDAVEQQFIGEVQFSIDQAATQLSCEPDWQLFDLTASCYKVGDSARFFAAAEADCVSMGAHVSSIHSDEENGFVTSMLVTGYPAMVQWTGLTRKGGAISFTDGSPVDYVNWAAGQPNTPNGNCVMLDDAASMQWNDVHCESRVMIYLCKKPAG